MSKLLLNTTSTVWMGLQGFGGLFVYEFGASGAPCVQVALLGSWLLAEGGKSVAPGFWAFQGDDAQKVAAMAVTIESGEDFGHCALMALADFLEGYIGGTKRNGDAV